MITESDVLTKTANGDLGKAEDFVASIGSDYYTSLQSAINAAEDGSEIVLLKSVPYSSEIEINKDLILNLNRNVLSSTAEKAIVVKEGSEFTLKNGSLYNTVGIGVFVEKLGEFTLSNDAIINAQGAGVKGTESDGTKGNIVMNIYGTITSNDIGVWSMGPNNEINIIGANVTSNYWTLYQNGSYGGSSFYIEIVPWRINLKAAPVSIFPTTCLIPTIQTRGRRLLPLSTAQ